MMTSPSTKMTSLISSTETVPRDLDAFDNRASNVTIIPGCLVLRKSNSSFVPWNNPENLVSQEMEAQVHAIVNVYVFTFLFCVSIPGNVVNMVVFWRQGLKERINLCLFFLAVTDFITVFTYFWFNVDMMVREFTPSAPSPKVFKFVVNHFFFLFAGFGYVSWFLCLIIAVERCVCIVFPLRASSLISTRTTLIIIVSAIVVIVGSHAVVVARVSVACVVDPETGAVTDAALPSKFYLNNAEVVDWLEGVGFGLILPGVCLFGVTTATTITVRQLRVVSKWRGLAMSGNATKSSSPANAMVNTSPTSIALISPTASSSATARSLQHTQANSVKTSSTSVTTSAKPEETSSVSVTTSAKPGETSSVSVTTSAKPGETSSVSVTTSAKSGEASSTSETTSAISVSAPELALIRMLIAISVFFIVLTTPIFVVQVVFLLVPEVRVGGKYHNLHLTLIRMDNLCFYLNASVNFFVYCITGSRFRKTLCDLFPCCGSAAPKSFKNSRSAAPKLQQTMTTVTEMSVTGMNSPN